MEVKIELDPVNDGIVKKMDKRNKDGMSLVIGTNADSRVVDEIEAGIILEEMGKNGAVEFIPNSPYFFVYNKDKVMNCEGDKFFVGSVLLSRIDRGVHFLSESDIEPAKKAFISRLIVVKNGYNQKISAYEML